MLPAEKQQPPPVRSLAGLKIKRESPSKVKRLPFMTTARVDRETEIDEGGRPVSMSALGRACATREPSLRPARDVASPPPRPTLGV